MDALLFGQDRIVQRVAVVFSRVQESSSENDPNQL